MLRRLVLPLALGGFLWGLDLGAPPHRQVTARALLASIHLYQHTLSPVLGRSGVRCRFEPTCSRYAASVIEARGALDGGRLAAWRLLRCGPWTQGSTSDPPPEATRSAPDA